MASFIALNSNHIVENGLNNTFRYEFAGSAANFQNHEIAIQSISLFSSQFNVDSTAFGNNTFAIEVPTAATVSTVSVSLPDGYYTYADINRNIQAALMGAGAYLIDSDGNDVFYLQLVENSVRYAAQIDFSPTPTALPSGFTRPSTGLYSVGGSGLPTTTRVPRLVIDNEAFGKLLGLSLGTYPAVSSTSATYQLSNTIPEVHPSSSYVVRCDLIENKFVPSGDILSAFDRSGSSIGQMIKYQPNESIWCSTHDGARASFSISIYDQLDRPVHFRDRSVSIMLVIRQRP